MYRMKEGGSLQKTVLEGGPGVCRYTAEQFCASPSLDAAGSFWAGTYSVLAIFFGMAAKRVTGKTAPAAMASAPSGPSAAASSLNVKLEV